MQSRQDELPVFLERRGHVLEVALYDQEHGVFTISDTSGNDIPAMSQRIGDLTTQPIAVLADPDRDSAPGKCRSGPG